MALLVVATLVVPTATTVASPARATSGSWLEDAGLGWLPSFLRAQTGLDIDWEAIFDGFGWRGTGDGGGSSDGTGEGSDGRGDPPSRPPVRVTPSASTSASAQPAPTATPTPTPTQVALPTITAPPPAPVPTPSMTDEPMQTPTPSMTSAPEPGAVPSPTQPSAPSAPSPSTSAGAPSSAPTPLPTVTVAPQPTPPPATPSTGTLLIKHGWDIPSPSWLASHQAAADAMPFDGVVVAMPGLSSTVLTSTPTSEAAYARVLAPLKPVRFDHLTHNFVIVYAGDDDGPLADWSVQASNLANLSAAARDAGFAGLAYDGERYFGGSHDWQSACSATLPECVAAARANGQRVMDAARAAWPSVTMLSFYGPWISDTETCSHTGGAACNDVSWANELFGPFVAGMADSASGTAATVVDGGEIYTLRTAAQFGAFHRWQQTVSPTISAGFGVYDQPWLGASMDASVWESTLRNALASTDRYVWAYTERYDWWGGDGTPVPREWIDATRESRSPTG